MKEELDTYFEQNIHLEQFTKQLFEQYFSGSQTPWSDCLYKDCVFFSSFTPALLGADSIRNFFKAHPLTGTVTFQSYSTLKLSPSDFLVFGTLLLQTKKETPPETVLITLVYRSVRGLPKIVYHHFSSNSDVCSIRTDKKAYSMPYNFFTTPAGIKNTAPIPLKSGNQVYYVSPDTIFYLQSNEHRTYVYCIDKTIDCSMLITEIAKLLPESFYPVRRGCIINTAFVAEIRRSEVTLCCGTTIRIPAANYTVVKKELEALITGH